MTPDAAIAFGVLGGAVVLFVTEWIRLDAVAVLALLALTLTGLLTPEEALAGFSDPVVILLAALFVVGEGLARTGVAERLGARIGRAAGGGEVRLLVATMVASALLSAFMSSTGAVAILLPVVLRLGANAGVSPGLLLMPLAFGALLGGMQTLIGTPPNLVVNAQLVAHSLPPLRFFPFAPVALCILVAGIAYCALVARRLLPQGAASGVAPALGHEEGRSLSAHDLGALYGLGGHVFRLRVRPGSPLAGGSVGAAAIRSRYGVNVLDVRPWPGEEATTATVTPETLLPPGQVVVMGGVGDAISRFAAENGLDILPGEATAKSLLSRSVGMAEVLLTPDSQLIGRTIADLRFRDRYGLGVAAIRRLGAPVEGDVSEVSLRFGDSLLVQGPWQRIGTLRGQRSDFVVLGVPADLAEAERREASRRAPRAIVITLAMLALMVTGVTPTVIAGMAAALALVVARCVTMEEAYTAINWQSLVLIAGMIPVATALQKTGGLDLVVAAFTTGAGGLGPRGVLAALFLVTSTLSLFVSNTATAIILAPAAMQIAEAAGAAPEPFLVTVALGASAAFATPMGSPVNTLVLAAGGYRFRDYVRIGVPLQIIALLLTVALVPVVFPLAR